MKLCIPTLVNYEGLKKLIASAEAGTVKPSHYIVIDNGGRLPYGAFDGLDAGRWVVTSLQKNAGVAASWNAFLRRFADEPLVISNDDIVFGERAFEELVGYAASGVPWAGYGWALFMQTPECTQKVGYYDENFWPAYFEDIDYLIRMKKAGVEGLRLEGKIDIQHGGWSTTLALGDPDWLKDGRARNLSYLIAKWGTDQYGVPYEKAFGAIDERSPSAARARGPLPLRFDIVNEIAKAIGAKRYLELGVANGDSIRRIKVEYKVGVDLTAPPTPPDCAEFYKFSTDEFFQRFDKEWKFDIVFIDADHAHEQVYRDVKNAIACLAPGGVVVMHDCSPFSEEMQVVPHNGSHFWTGDVWKTIVRLRYEGEHAVFTVNTDFGVGIVIPGGKPRHFARRPYKVSELTYADLARDRENLLGLVSGWAWKDAFNEAYGPRRAALRAQETSTGGERPEMLGIVDRMDAGAQQREKPRRAYQKNVHGQAYEHYKRHELVVIFTKIPTPETTGSHLLRAFEKIGITVRHWDPYEKDMSERPMPLFEHAKAVLCIDDDHGWSLPVVDCPRYYWCIDSYRMDDQLSGGNRHGASFTRRRRVNCFLEKVFYAQKSHADEFGGAWLPLGVDVSKWTNATREKIFDVCFVGHHNHARAAFVGAVLEHFPKHWNGIAYGEAGNEIYNQSRIALNVSAGNDINMRMFEGQATSALLVSSAPGNGERELLPYLPTFRKTVGCLESGEVAEAVALIRFFLAHPRIAERLSVVQRQDMYRHTYERRAEEFLREIRW